MEKTGLKTSKIFSFALLFCTICTIVVMPACAEQIPPQSPEFSVTLPVGFYDWSQYVDITETIPSGVDMYLYGTCNIDGTVPSGDWEGDPFSVSAIDKLDSFSIPIGYVVIYDAGDGGETIPQEQFDDYYGTPTFNQMGRVYEILSSSELLPVFRNANERVVWYSPPDYDERSNMGFNSVTVRGYLFDNVINTDAQQWQLRQSYDDGYQAGRQYQAGLQSVPHTWTDFFRGIIEAPIHAAASVFDFSIGGVVIVDAFVTVVLVLVCLFVIGKLWEAIHG